MNLPFKKVAVLAPHTDDGELGLGASIHKMVKAGVEVKYFAFSTAFESLNDKKKGDILSVEVKRALSWLGLSADAIDIMKFKVRNFPAARQEILDSLIKIRKDFDPDTVFTPAIGDIHQDHSVVSAEALRAFKHSNVLGYELPWNNFQFQTQLSIDVNIDNIEKKIAALGEYKSQQHRPYMDKEFIKSQAKFRGVQSNMEYCESFEVYKWMIR